MKILLTFLLVLLSLNVKAADTPINTKTIVTAPSASTHYVISEGNVIKRIPYLDATRHALSNATVYSGVSGIALSISNRVTADNNGMVYRHTVQEAGGQPSFGPNQVYRQGWNIDVNGAILNPTNGAIFDTWEGNYEQTLDEVWVERHFTAIPTNRPEQRYMSFYNVTKSPTTNRLGLGAAAMNSDRWLWSDRWNTTPIVDWQVNNISSAGKATNAIMYMYNGTKQSYALTPLFNGVLMDIATPAVRTLISYDQPNDRIVWGNGTSPTWIQSGGTSMLLGNSLNFVSSTLKDIGVINGYPANLTLLGGSNWRTNNADAGGVTAVMTNGSLRITGGRVELNKETLIPPGSTLTVDLGNVANNIAIKLGAGTYTVTPSILNSNFLSANTFTGVTFANKTNVTITGVPGLSIIDGSSAMGELLWVSNCSRITISGVTFRGYTNHAIATMPNTYLWAGVNVFKSEHITFDNCIFERHADHGLQDKGAETSSGGNIATAPPSTNNMVVRNCKFEDIGGWRINGGNVYGEGTAIVPTGWTIEGCQFVGCQRGIEPYDEANADGQVFHNTIIRDNTFRNMVEFAISPAGSTNCHNALISGNTLINDNAFVHHGTNYSVGNFASHCIGFMLNGGRGWTVINNSARGNMYTGFIFGNANSFCEDFLVENNVATDINRGDGFGIGFQFGANVDTAAAASSTRRFDVRGNRVFNTAQNGFLVVGSRDSSFVGNRSVKGQLYTSVDIGISNFRFGTTGFTINKLTNITVSGNTAVDNGAGSPFGFGLHDNIQSLTFENNNGYNFAVSAMTNRAGSAAAILGSPRTFTGTIDLPSIGIGSQFTTNFTATGVSTNDAVTIHIPAQFYASGDTTNMIANAWCSNATVYVKFANNDGVRAADAPSVRITATVRQFQAE